MSRIRSSEELWRAVHAALDERRDPFADEDVCTWLAEHAEDLDEVARLDGGLRALARPRRRRFAKLGVALAACVAASVAAALLLLTFHREPARPHAPVASRSEVLDYRLSVATETPTLRVAATLENGRFVREREDRFATNDGSGNVASARMTSTIRKAGPR